MTTGLSYPAIVQQITKNTGGLFKYVAFSITPQQIDWLAANPAYPAAFVSPAEKSAEGNDVGSAGDIRQWITEKFSVVCLFATDGDMLGQNAMSAIPLFRETLRKALVNWHPLPLGRTSQPIIEDDDSLFIYEGGARAGWMFNYSQRYQIYTDDCYSPLVTPPPILFEIAMPFTYGGG